MDTDKIVRVLKTTKRLEVLNGFISLGWILFPAVVLWLGVASGGFSALTIVALIVTWLTLLGFIHVINYSTTALRATIEKSNEPKPEGGLELKISSKVSKV